MKASTVQAADGSPCETATSTAGSSEERTDQRDELEHAGDEREAGRRMHPDHCEGEPGQEARHHHGEELAEERERGQPITEWALSASGSFSRPARGLGAHRRPKRA